MRKEWVLAIVGGDVLTRRVELWHASAPSKRFREIVSIELVKRGTLQRVPDHSLTLGGPPVPSEWLVRSRKPLSGPWLKPRELTWVGQPVHLGYAIPFDKLVFGGRDKRKPDGGLTPDVVEAPATEWISMDVQPKWVGWYDVLRNDGSVRRYFRRDLWWSVEGPGLAFSTDLIGNPGTHWRGMREPESGVSYRPVASKKEKRLADRFLFTGK